MSVGAWLWVVFPLHCTCWKPAPCYGGFLEHSWRSADLMKREQDDQQFWSPHLFFMPHHISACACSHPPTSSIRSDLGAYEWPHLQQRAQPFLPENHCPDAEQDVKVRKREETISPSGNCPLTPQTQKSQWSFSSPNQLKCLSLMQSLKISAFSTNSLKMLKMKSNKRCRTSDSLNYRAIFLRAKQNNTPPPAPQPSLLKFIVRFLG